MRTPVHSTDRPDRGHMYRCDREGCGREAFVPAPQRDELTTVPYGWLSLKFRSTPQQSVCDYQFCSPKCLWDDLCQLVLSGVPE